MIWSVLRISRSPAETGFALGVGRLVEEKGFDVLVEAVSMIDAEARPELTIVGVGPEQSCLESQARRLGVKLRLPGSVPPLELPYWYRRASVVVVPSRRGFGIVAAEASAAGRVVVATKVGAMPQIIDDGVSGLLVDPGNADDLYRVAPGRAELGRTGPSRVLGLGSDAHGQRVAIM